MRRPYSERLVRDIKHKGREPKILPTTLTWSNALAMFSDIEIYRLMLKLRTLLGLCCTPQPLSATMKSTAVYTAEREKQRRMYLY